MAVTVKRLNDIFRGDTKTYKFNFGVGVDITGWTIWFTLKNDRDQGDAYAVLQTFSTAGSNVNDDVLNGIMYLTIPSTLTDEIEPAIYWYDFQRVIPGSPPDVRTLLTGQVEIIPDITRSIT